ncbi:hypothetical protein FZD47_25510 [Bacillus infantis]|uniref:Uncharacterized protein n=1 Tax=Bacillus infantis TaxID=324767 RepID=A0A5D4RWL7_9BACI|nr:hypothetical protein [Bacillus infantis]TYS55785.1 hypothetical protein FZD47_25510 [Bacillus infantis]
MTSTKTENEKLVELLITIAKRNKIALENYIEDTNLCVLELLSNLLDAGLLPNDIYVQSVNIIR